MAEENKPTPEGGGSIPQEHQPERETLESVQELAPETPPQQQGESVPLKKFMQEKDGRREAEAKAEKLQEEVARLQQQMVGMTVGGVSDEVKRLAKEYQVDEAFVSSVVSVAKKASKEEILAEMEGTISPKLTKIEQERQQEQRDRKFDSLFEKTLTDMPEYQGIVSKEAIKALAMNPANAKKTLPEILEATYGNAVKGKRTVDGGRPAREQTAPDTRNPSTAEDWDRINSDPEARKEWAQSAEDQLRQHL